MPTLSVGSVRSRAKLYTSLGKTPEDALAQIATRQKPNDMYDIFFSSQMLEPDLLLGVKLTLDDYGFKSTFEWPLEPPGRRMQITAERANSLREKLDHCRSFLYVTTSARTECAWLPWAFGYCEGKHGLTAVLPLMPTSAEIYRGEDYLDIYPYISSHTMKNQKNILVVMHARQIYCTFENWLNGSEELLEM